MVPPSTDSPSDRPPEPGRETKETHTKRDRTDAETVDKTIETEPNTPMVGGKAVKPIRDAGTPMTGGEGKPLRTEPETPMVGGESKRVREAKKKRTDRNDS